jgi:hypothetical protein
LIDHSADTVAAYENLQVAGDLLDERMAT